jgi:hypothetical protein
MKGAYNTNSAYSNACVLKVFIRVAYSTTNNAYSGCLNVLKVLMLLIMPT